MITKFFKKCSLNYFISKDCKVFKKKYCSLAHPQVGPKSLVQFNVTRNKKDLFEEHFIENLFLNKIQLTIFEYPQIDSLKEIQSLDNICRNVKKLLKDHSSLTQDNEPSKNLTTLPALKSLELSGFQLPISKNGYGFLEMESTFMQETLSSVNSNLAKVVAENENFGIDLINQFGSEIQKDKYLPKLASGESLVCFAYLESEPFISLDPISINLEAVQSADNETFTVSGEKNWVYNAKNADILIFLANITLPSKNGILKKPTLFVVDKNLKGINVHQPNKTVGLKDLDISSITFNKVEVPSSCILGQPDETEKLFKKIFSKRKLCDGVQCLVLMKKLINSVIYHCIHNTVFKKSKCDHEFYKIEVGKLVSRLYAVESMIYLIAGRLDHFDNADVFLESLILKIFSSETLQYILEQTLTILGSEIYSEENKDLRNLLTDSHFFSSCEHTNDYLKTVLSRTGLKHVFQYRSDRSTLELLKNLVSKQELKELTMTRHSESFNYSFTVCGYLHKIFVEQSYFVEDSVFLLKKTVDYLLKKYDKNIYNRHIEMQLLANLVVNIYAMIAVLGRSNRAYCLAFQNNDTDRDIAEVEVLRLKFQCDNIVKKIKSEQLIQNLTGIDCKIQNYGLEG